MISAFAREIMLQENGIFQIWPDILARTRNN